MLRIILTLLLLASSASAQERIVAGLSHNRVAITANFDGSSLLIFGAIKRDGATSDKAPLQVVIAVTGPSHSLVVRRKQRVFGIWINRASVAVDAAPSFYAVASTVPLAKAISPAQNRRYKISITNLIRTDKTASKTPDAKAFSRAVIRIRYNNGLYAKKDGAIKMTDETLFQTRISLPANLIEGDYQARIFLTRDRKVISVYKTSIAVRKVGLERWIYNLAHKRPLIYGLLSLVIAISAGWLAATVFRLLRIT